MTQQINLLKKEFEYQARLFPGNVFINSVLLLLAISFIILAWSYSKLYYYKHQISRINHFEAEANNRINLAKTAYMKKEVNKEFLTEIKNLEEILYAKSVIQAKLKYFLNNDYAFSPILSALSRQHLKGIRLTNIELSYENNIFQLQGISVNPKLVTHYVERLQLEPSIRGKRFDNFIIGSKNNRNAEIFIFRVGNIDLSSNNEK